MRSRCRPAAASLTFWTSYDTEERLGPPHRRGPDGGRRRLDDAARRQRPHDPEHRRQLPGGLARPAPAARPLPDAQPGDATCTPTGTTGAWNAASGNSDGWQEWSIDLNAVRRPAVEVSIAYISDWGTQSLGTFLDDVDAARRHDHVVRGRTSTAGRSPARRRAAARTPTTGSGHGRRRVPRSARRSRRPSSLLMGYGFEGISTAAERKEVMGRAAAAPPRRRLIHASGGRLWAAPATWVLQALVMYGGRQAPSRHGLGGRGCLLGRARGGPF